MKAIPRPIDIAELERMLQDRGEWAMFDVREPVEAERGHIPGATALPRRRLELRIEALVRDRGTRVVLVDDDTGRAALAAQRLVGLGYQQVVWLQGGVQAWRDAGHPIATGTNVPSKLFGERVYHDLETPDVTAQQLAQWKEAGRNVAILDVRTPEEYAEACIPGASGAPSFDLARHAGDLAHHPDVVVVHCAGRTRSLIAAQTLRELGVEQVVALENGTMGWRLAGLMLEHGAIRRLAPPSATSLAQATQTSQALADAEGVEAMDAAMLAILLRQSHDLYVFDVRQLDAYAEGHIPGAQAVPGGQVIQRADDFIPVRNARIVLADDDGIRARLTAVWLRRMGFPHVSVLAGGLAAWRAAGGTLETGRARKAPAGWTAARAAAVMQMPASCAAMLREQADLIVLDVDASTQFCRGHVPGARWMPRGWLELRIAAMAPDTSQPLLLTCRNGMHSVLAAQTLAALGYRSVVVLEGGTIAWRRAGYPLDTAVLPPQDDTVLPPYARGEQAMRDYLAWETELVRK